MVKRRLNLDYTYAQMGKMISVENPTNTRILKVTVQSDDPQEAADMALTYVQVAREFIAAKMDMDMPTIFEEPQLPTRPYSPSTMKNTVLGFLLGLLLMCGIVVVQFLAPQAGYQQLVSIQPFANIIGDYTCQDRKNKRKDIIHK